MGSPVREEGQRSRLGQLRQHDGVAGQEEEAPGRCRKEREYDPCSVLKVAGNLENLLKMAGNLKIF